MDAPEKIRVLFVCLGNICRSPMAEAVFQYLVDQAGLNDRFEIASAATSAWEVGGPVHPGTRLILRERHIPLSPHKRAVQLKAADYQHYDYILVMDNENLAAMRHASNVQRLMDFAPPDSSPNVPDPYYTGNFEIVYDMIRLACENLLAVIREKHNF